jgi:hypothetical protein
LNQKDIVIRKVPKILADLLVEELVSKVEIPSIYFAKSKVGYHWLVQKLSKITGRELGQSDDEEDPDWVNLRLSFNPSAALKVIIEMITGKKPPSIDDLRPLPKVEEHGWFPTYGGWTYVARHHIHDWTYDTERLKYASDDVKYLRIVREYLGNPLAGDNDCQLAWAVGAMFWRGFTVDLVAAKAQLAKMKEKVSNCPVNVNAPKQVLHYLQESCSEMEKLVLCNTKKETLQSIVEDWGEDNPELCKRITFIQEARRAYREIDLLEKLLVAKKMHVNFKISGTKTNRAAGGSEGFVSKGGSINPQGIKKGNDIRSIFTLAREDEELDGGDFDAFEVSIAEAEYNDPGLREVLLSGQKIHGLFAEEIYKVDCEQNPDKYKSHPTPLTYDYILSFSKSNENDFTGWYGRGKKGVFAFMYGGQALKISQCMLVTEEIAYEGIQNLSHRFPGIKRSQEIIYEDFAALRQPEGPGTQVMWKDPKCYVESFLGFRRYFDLEFRIVRVLFDMANDLPDSLVDAGKRLKVKRRERIQTGQGAVRSALYGAAFGLQSAVMRAAANHKIQSPGGDITKYTQAKIWEVQPHGCGQWLVMPMNIHDEIETPCHPSVAEKVEKAVYSSIEHFREKVPLIGMSWKRNMKNWGEK